MEPSLRVSDSRLSCGSEACVHRAASETKLWHVSARLNDKQVAVLEWMRAGMPAGVYESGYGHCVVARALQWPWWNMARSDD